MIMDAKLSKKDPTPFEAKSHRARLSIQGIRQPSPDEGLLTLLAGLTFAAWLRPFTITAPSELEWDPQVTAKPNHLILFKSN